jgi:formamidopyrimidine-DNA glycosylase
MPELPEVETTRRGIAPALTGQRIRRLVVRDRRLRWPVPDGLEQQLAGARIDAVDRRAKYLLLRSDRGSALLHLVMSGSLRLIFDGAPPGPHDHYDMILDDGPVLRFNDPRRFGSLLWAGDDPAAHPLLRDLGPEPLEPEFNGEYLYAASRRRRVAIKPHIMNAHVVVGVGNIYASEALFRAGVHPKRRAGRIALARCERIADSIKAVLRESIRAGGTTLRDFYGGDGQPGYFTQDLRVYDREGEACLQCGDTIRQTVLGQRSTYYCLNCQR